MDDSEEVEGPLVATWTWWSGGSGAHRLTNKMVERILRINGVLYAEFHDGWDGEADAPQIILVSVVTLIRDYTREYR